MGKSMDNTSSANTISKDTLYEIELKGINIPNSVKVILSKGAQMNMNLHRRLVDMTENEFKVVMDAFVKNNHDILNDFITDNDRILIRLDPSLGTYTIFYFDHYDEGFVCKRNLSPEDTIKVLIMNGVNPNDICNDPRTGKMRMKSDESQPQTTVCAYFDNVDKRYEDTNFNCPYIDTRDFVGGKCYRCPAHCMIVG